MTKQSTQALPKWPPSQSADVPMFAKPQGAIANADDLPGKAWAHLSRTLNGALFQ